jgi:hypothetical protein
MLGMIELPPRCLGSLVTSRRRLEAENLVLRHQLGHFAPVGVPRPWPRTNLRNFKSERLVVDPYPLLTSIGTVS